MKSDFHERREKRIERLQVRVKKHRTEGESRLNQARKMASVIPFGQPILVGHHSEKGDRRFRDKIHNNYGKGFSSLKYADSLEERIKTAESNKAIFSDDPEAITKLKEKIASLEKNQQLMKDANKVIKSKKSEAEKVEELVKLGFKESQAIELLQPDFCGRIGFASYSLTNNNANINTAKKRLEFLEKQAQDTTTTKEYEGFKVVDNVEDNRLQLFFDEKPSEAMRKQLKGFGFKWAPSVGAWQRYRGNTANWSIKYILESFQNESI
jgi:hypothetical protein